MHGEVQLQPMDVHKRNERNAEDSAPSPFCRICLKKDRNDIFGDGLMSPCMCGGTKQFVHRSCFIDWRSRKVGFAFSHCSTCKAQFHFRVDFCDHMDSWRRKFAFMSNWELLLWFLAVQPAIAVIAGLAYMMDKNEEFRNNIKNSPLYQNRILAIYPIPFYYLIGLVTFSLLVWVLIIIIEVIAKFSRPRPVRWF